MVAIKHPIYSINLIIEDNELNYKIYYSYNYRYNSRLYSVFNNLFSSGAE